MKKKAEPTCADCHHFVKPDTSHNDKGELLNGWCYFRKHGQWTTEKGPISWVSPMMGAARHCGEGYKPAASGKRA